MSRLYLIRHGNTEANLQHRYCGSTDLPLSQPGREALEKLQYDVGPVRFLTSGMLRTEQTLHALYGDVPYTVLPGLREMDFGDFEMKSYQQLKDTPAYQAWIADVEHNPCPNGESAPQVLARNRAAMDRVLAAGEDAVCVIHGGVTAGLMMTWFGGGRYDYSVKPGTGFTVTFENGRPVSYVRVPE